MTPEDKELLLKDLLGRLPYGVKVLYEEEIYQISIVEIFNETITICGRGYPMEVEIQKVKPYLFPLSSMTEEQYNEFFSYFHSVEMEEVRTSGDYLKAAYLGENAKREWLDKNHFDYHYLIPMDLAIDATGKNIY